MKASEITARRIFLVSDDGRYTISSRRISMQDGYRLEMGATFKGSSWTGVLITKDNERVSYIQVNRGNWQPLISYSEWGCGLLQHGMKLTKDVILYGAYISGLFTKALEGIDCKRIEKNYVKEYWKCRAKQIEDEIANNIINPVTTKEQ